MAKNVSKGINWAVLLSFVVLAQLAGIIGSAFTFQAIPEWYAGLEKPFFTPPSWVFGPVWTTLYLMMGVAAYLVWEKKPEIGKIRAPLAIFGIQLALNTIWSIAFFGFRFPWAGVAVIILLWLAIAATIRSFWGVSRTAAYLLIPYIMWVSFAALLTLAVALLNP
ncbi:tryptophan-rich sensory protein [Candidatus Micrarchaeota archaeon]|nr:tryptophan-rich sensory protein [Candidatus Micrarchaeota archaeon]